MALPTKLLLEIIIPYRSIVREEVDEVVVPGSEGFFGILPGHTPLLATLQVGELWYRKGQEKFHLAIAYGFVEVLPDRVTILATMAERSEEIDTERAERAHRRAEERMAQASTQPGLDFERARVAMMKSLIRLQVAARARTRA